MDTFKKRILLIAEMESAFKKDLDILRRNVSRIGEALQLLTRVKDGKSSDKEHVAWKNLIASGIVFSNKV